MNENKIGIRRLEAPVPGEFAGMTFPAYRRLLALERTSRHPEQGDRRQIDPLALAAWRGGEPVGLLLAELPVEGEKAEVLSVYVRPAVRGQGIASALVAEVENLLRAGRFAEIVAVYTAGKPPFGERGRSLASEPAPGQRLGPREMDEKPEIAYLERIFVRRGWSPPEPRTLSVRFTPEAAMAAPLFAEKRRRVLARDLEIFPWSELQPAEHREMKRSNDRRRWIEPALEPWRFDRFGFDPSSVGARYRGRVVGWVINHRVSEEVVRFTCSFMRKDLSRRGRILPLYHAVLERLQPTPCRLCTFVTPFSYPGMVGLIRRWIVPFACFVGETRGTRLRLRPTGA